MIDHPALSARRMVGAAMPPAGMGAPAGNRRPRLDQLPECSVRSRKSAGRHASHRPISVGGLPDPTRKLLLPRCSPQRWRQHRTRQCSPLLGRFRRHKSNGRVPIPNPTDDSHHRATGRTAVFRTDAPVRIRLGENWLSAVQFTCVRLGTRAADALPPPKIFGPPTCLATSAHVANFLRRGKKIG